MQAVPVRYGNPVVAVSTHQSALAGRGDASPLDSAYLDCTGDQLFMVSEDIRHVIEAEVGATVLATWQTEDGVLLSEDVDAEQIHT